MKKECIAAGEVLMELDEFGKVAKSITAAVYVEKAVAGEESGSVAEAKKSVVLRYKDYAYTEDVAAPMGFEEIAAAAGELKVPGLNGNEDVVLSAPVAVKYSKTKAFEANANTVVFATLRYEM